MFYQQTNVQISNIITYLTTGESLVSSQFQFKYIVQLGENY